MAEDKRKIIGDAVEKRNSNDPPATPRPDVTPVGQDGTVPEEAPQGDQGGDSSKANGV